MARVALKNVGKLGTDKNGKEVSIFEDLTLEVQDREFVVLVGPVGSGLSSIIRVIAGLTEISNGEVFIGDRPVNGLAPKDRNVAVVFPNQQPYPAMSVYENLAFSL